jgi:hypothetical protein
MTIGHFLDQLLEYVAAGEASGFQPYKEVRPELQGSSMPPIAFILHQVHYFAFAPAIMSRAIRRQS